MLLNPADDGAPQSRRREQDPLDRTEGIVPEYHRHIKAGGAPREGVVPGARRLSVEESARVETFPPELVFEGARSSQLTQVGDAVPPKLAEALGLALASQLERSGEVIDLMSPQPLQKSLASAP